MKMGFMSRKYRFNEIGWNWWSNAGYVGIAETILRSVVGVVGVVSVISIITAILVSIVMAVLGSIRVTAVVSLWGISLFGAASFLGDNIIFGGGVGSSIGACFSWWASQAWAIARANSGRSWEHLVHETRIVKINLPVEGATAPFASTKSSKRVHGRQ